jgi:hypothetical protein
MNSSKYKAPFGRLPRGNFVRDVHNVSEWQPWFAWRPVRFYSEVRFAWLRRVSRRFVLTAPKHLHPEYTDRPGEFPRGFGLKK